MIVIVVVAAVAALTILLIARPFLFASLDPDVAAARGIPVRLLGLVFMVLLAVTVAEAMQAVGALLVFALLLLPAAISHRLSIRPFMGLVLAVVFALVLTWMGLTFGFYSGLPSSVCISLLAFIAYVAVVGAYAIRQRLDTRRFIHDLEPESATSSLGEKVK